jgi:hypothetical protein
MPDIVAAKLKKSDGRADFVADPAVQLRDAFVPLTLLTRRSHQYATHSTFPKIRYSLIGPDNTRLG